MSSSEVIAGIVVGGGFACCVSSTAVVDDGPNCPSSSGDGAMPWTMRDGPLRSNYCKNFSHIDLAKNSWGGGISEVWVTPQKVPG